MTPVEPHLVNANSVAERLRAELEQAHVAMEDMSERVAELVRANDELAAKLKEEACLRAAIEAQLRELREHTGPRPERTDDAALRQELSVALEELQVMQEELQAAHDALSIARQPPG
jgi:chromosome segregation ATPase